MGSVTETGPPPLAEIFEACVGCKWTLRVLAHVRGPLARRLTVGDRVRLVEAPDSGDPTVEEAR